MNYSSSLFYEEGLSWEKIMQKNGICTRGFALTLAIYRRLLVSIFPTASKRTSQRSPFLSFLSFSLLQYDKIKVDLCQVLLAQVQKERDSIEINRTYMKLVIQVRGACGAKPFSTPDCVHDLLCFCLIY